MTLPGSVRVALVLGILLPSILRAQAPPVSDSVLRDVALRVSELEVRRQLPRATPATIDSLLAFYSDAVVYEHPGVGAVVRGKASLRAGMLRYLGSMPAATVEAPRIVIGPHVAVLESTARPDPRDPTRPVPATRKANRVLEFDARGLVRRIVDYPW
jgi:SnoaL-like domain